MTYKTLEWATARCTVVAGEIDRLARHGIRTPAQFEEIMQLRGELKRLEALVAALGELVPEPGRSALVDPAPRPGDPIGAPAEPS